MKAVVLRAFGDSSNFEDVDLPVPPLRPGDVRIRMKAASFNPVDCQIRRGGSESRLLPSMILGRDLSGTVEAVHSNVRDFAIGDEVFSYVCTRASSGTYAELVSVPAELVAKKPLSLTYEEAAATPVAAITAALALPETMVGASTSLFIAGGAGGVGTFALRIARMLGVRRVITTAGNARSRAYLLEHCGLRPEQVVDYNDPDFIAKAMAGNGGPFDVALDLVGGSMLSACCALLAVDGIVSSCTEAPSTDGFETLFQKNALFHSVGANAYSLVDDRRVWLKYRDLLDDLSQRFDRGDLSPPSIRILGPLSSQVVREGHRLLEGGLIQGKLVMSGA